MDGVVQSVCLPGGDSWGGGVLKGRGDSSVYEKEKGKATWDIRARVEKACIYPSLQNAAIYPFCRRTTSRGLLHRGRWGT